MKQQVRIFHISDILTVTTDYPVSERCFEGIRDILSYMTGNPQDFFDAATIPPAMKMCRKRLLQQYPCLKSIKPTQKDLKDHYKWVLKQSAVFGETLPVQPL